MAGGIYITSDLLSTSSMFRANFSVFRKVPSHRKERKQMNFMED